MQKQPTIPFTTARNYFVKNTVKTDSAQTLVITDQATFDSYFGMATVMGPNGSPTPVDFTKQFVLAVAGKATTTGTEILPVGLKSVGNMLQFSYQSKTGQPQTFTTVPCLVIVVDKKYKRELIVFTKDKGGA